MKTRLLSATGIALALALSAAAITQAVNAAPARGPTVTPQVIRRVHSPLVRWNTAQTKPIACNASIRGSAKIFATMAKVVTCPIPAPPKRNKYTCQATNTSVMIAVIRCR